jgi:trehalose 6-phosphate synthase
MALHEERGRLVIASNRLPIVATRHEGRWRLRPGSGGLVTALAPVLRDRGGVWIGWPGIAGGRDEELSRVLAAGAREAGYRLVPVHLDARDQRLYYQGFANEIVWPLFHDLQGRCRFDPEAWEVYTSVNARFAHAIAGELRPDDFLWIHDYHLLQVAAQLRRHGLGQRAAFFLHIPFPPLDIFLKLPQRSRILADMLAHDLLGFQVPRDLRNFTQCVRALFRGEARLVREHGRTTIDFRGREIQAGSFPIGIDFAAFAARSAEPAVARRARFVHAAGHDRQIALGVDRLDYTKGLPEKLCAFREMLRRWPELQGQLTLMQVVVPSRHDIREYRALKEELNRLVGDINGEFSRPDWVPVHYVYRSLSRDELLAHYRMADIMLVTPLKDGMNLVAKEYVACKHERNGVLVLSEFAGAAAQLHRWALTVNPHDTLHMAEAIRTAFAMPAAERRRRLNAMRRAVAGQDVFWWVNAFLQAAVHRGLDDFPPHEEFVASVDDAYAARGDGA